MMNSGNGLRNVRALVFDVFGTIAQIEDNRATYTKLIRLARKGPLPHAVDSKELMTSDAGLRAITALMNLTVSESDLVKLDADLQAELKSISLFADATPTLLELKRRGFKLGICSNSAQPFAAPIEELLPVRLDGIAWSFRVGAVKPDAAIYRYICDELDCFPEEILMVGDTFKTDVLGPRFFGMESIQLDRRKVGDSPSTLSKLTGLLDLL